ncbi:hypothetical protein [Cryobacterium sp. SO1]|uniref:hypothetical protein n=1 Tax=Cryobacterium sp. SO1 TaxID=1897061 RepID=UPI001022A7A6|nr:hypothetical protein [Cryobacterium sp. SO1]RZI34226.1 hypothetical protein BJQ95_03367 [Cryobacterium sp. SO1]
MNGHNHGGKSHLIGMIVIGVVILGGLLVAGRSIGEALPIAAVLACPVMMIGMMFMMMRSGKATGSDTSNDSHVHAATDETAKTTTQA